MPKYVGINGKQKFVSNFNVPQPCHISVHYLELGSHLLLILQENTLLDKIADLNTVLPNSEISHSTFLHCPMACTLQSMSLETPVW